MPQALTITQTGDNPQFALQKYDLPQLRSTQVLVEWHWAALNRADLLYPRHQYFKKPQAGSRMGFEAAGVVREAGEKSTFSKGDKVAILPLSIDLASQGCLAEAGVYESEQLVGCVEALDMKQNAAFWMAYLTAYGGMIDQGQLQAGQTALITAASSAVGLACLQACQALSAESIATTTSMEKLQALREAGADHALLQPRDSDQLSRFVAQVKEITGNRGCDLVFDAVAGPASRAMIQGSKRGGRYIIHGMLDRRPMDVHPGVLMKRQLTLQGYTLDVSLEQSARRTHVIAALRALADQRALSPRIDAEFTLGTADQALDCLAQNRHWGKIIIDCRSSY